MSTMQQDYEFLDAGNGRKLERFGAVVLNRPAPPAEGLKKRFSKLWKTATARYERTENETGVWKPAKALPEKWPVSIGPVTFELRPSPFGHVGVFPEQATQWAWIANKIRKANRPLRVLNLFAYTGGSTLAAAAAGAEVTHVDSAKNIVERAKRNAVLSNLENKPVRWIVEDVPKYCQRELKRKSYYDAILLDPPTYGHGTKGESWKITRDLLPLLETCRQLLTNRFAFFLTTCHSPGIGPAELSAYLSEGIFGSCAQNPKSGAMVLGNAADSAMDNTSENAPSVPAGVFARWPN